MMSIRFTFIWESSAPLPSASLAHRDSGVILRTGLLSRNPPTKFYDQSSWGFVHANSVRLYWIIFSAVLSLACENIRFSSLFAAGDVSRGGTSATQRQKFHTDVAIQCLHNKSSARVPNTNLSNFTSLLVDFGKVLCLSANELQQNSNASSGEDYIPQILTVLLEILRIYIWPLWPFVFCLSFVNNS